VLVKVRGLGVGGSLGIPGLFRASCLWGQCCRPLRDDLWGPFPDAMKERGLRSRDVPRHSRGAHFHDEGGPCERSLCG
jgi:hypothetical protein